MIRVNIKDKEDINRALKRFKKKFEKAQVIKDYRNNAFFTKKSVQLREEKLKASYIQRLQSKEL
ncbi:MAG: 30S ribosomal protein S21 [Bacteroidota bacterium]|nr:30S ribosomal protein S21 [Bacteroidota bacterium]